MNTTQRAITVGPDDDPLTAACSLPIERSELEEYVVSSEVTEPVGLLVDHDASKTEFWILSRQKHGSGYIVDSHETISITDGILTLVRDKPRNLTLSEAVEIARLSSNHDLVTAKRIYASRACSTHDPTYAYVHALADLDTGYATLSEQYENAPSWHTALRLFWFISLTAMILPNITTKLKTALTSISNDIFKTFKNGSSIEGDREELDMFIDRIGDLAIDIRKLLHTA